MAGGLACLVAPPVDKEVLPRNKGTAALAALSDSLPNTFNHASSWSQPLVAVLFMPPWRLAKDSSRHIDTFVVMIPAVIEVN